MSPTAVGNRTLPRGPPRNPLRVMFRAVGACEQHVRSGARGFPSHRLRSLLSIRKFCRLRVNARLIGLVAAEVLGAVAPLMLLLQSGQIANR